MELADSLQALESVSQGVGQVAKQGVDKLLKVVPLVGPDRDKVIEYFVVASERGAADVARRDVRPGRDSGGRSSELIPVSFGRGMDATIQQCTFL